MKRKTLAWSLIGTALVLTVACGSDDKGKTTTRPKGGGGGGTKVTDLKVDPNKGPADAAINGLWLQKKPEVSSQGREDTVVWKIDFKTGERSADLTIEKKCAKGDKTPVKVKDSKKVSLDKDTVDISKTFSAKGKLEKDDDCTINENLKIYQLEVGASSLRLKNDANSVVYEFCKVSEKNGEYEETGDCQSDKTTSQKARQDREKREAERRKKREEEEARKPKNSKMQAQLEGKWIQHNSASNPQGIAAYDMIRITAAGDSIAKVRVCFVGNDPNKRVAPVVRASAIIDDKNIEVKTDEPKTLKLNNFDCKVDMIKGKYTYTISEGAGSKKILKIKNASGAEEIYESYVSDEDSQDLE